VTRRVPKTAAIALSLLVAGAALLVAMALLHGRGHRCDAQPLPVLSGANAESWAALAITAVPCPASGRVAYRLRDDRGDPMDVLDPIAAPGGGYLGVFDAPRAGPGGSKPAAYRVMLARSDDLLHWRRVAVLDPTGATMPTLAPVPGGGFLLAYEKTLGDHDHVRVSYYPSLQALEAARPTAARNLPLRFSKLNDGTPSLRAIAWHGGPDRSLVTIAFHYETTAAGGGPGPDREAVGTLEDFRRWSAHRDPLVDRRLSGLGLVGNHGDQRQFQLDGRRWRVYEAQGHFDDFATWHVVLYNTAARKAMPLRLRTRGGRFSTSFGNPVVRVLPAPSGRGRVLAVTLFVFSSGQAASDAGELVYLQPLAGAALSHRG